MHWKVQEDFTVILNIRKNASKMNDYGETNITTPFY